MHFLQTMLEHRPVGLNQQFIVDTDSEVWGDPKKIAVECRVVDLAETQAVDNNWFATFMRIADDVGRIKQTAVTQSANGAASFVCAQDATAELSLM